MGGAAWWNNTYKTIFNVCDNIGMIIPHGSDPINVYGSEEQHIFFQKTCFYHCSFNYSFSQKEYIVAYFQEIF